MKIDNGLKFKHLTKGYYQDLKTGKIYSRHGADMEGLREVNKTKKLMEKLKPYL